MDSSSFQPTPSSLANSVRLIVVDFRSGEDVTHHPQLKAWLEQGWVIRNAAPRTTPEGAKLLVVLTHSLSTKPRPPRQWDPGNNPTAVHVLPPECGLPEPHDAANEAREPLD
jgi:hypothetical protein